MTLRKLFGCGRTECLVSTGIDGTPTFGSGELDEHGYWEHPCDKCARAWEKEKGEPAWPPPEFPSP